MPKPLAVVERSDHREVHYEDRVEFWSLDGVKVGTSSVEREK